MTAPAPEKAAPIPALLPCPFCGANAPRKFNDPDEFGRPSHGVQCTGGECAICGPQRETESEAVAAWNRRADRASQEERIREDEFPKLPAAIVQAAAEAHYGKRRVAENGGPDGISMTVDNRDFSFRDMMKRMWPAIRKAAAADRARPGRRVMSRQLAKRLRAHACGHLPLGWTDERMLLEEAAAALEAEASEGEREHHATEARLARLMGALRRIKWNRHRRPELSDGGTEAAFQDIFDMMFADALDAALIPAPAREGE